MYEMLVRLPILSHLLCLLNSVNSPFAGDVRELGFSKLFYVQPCLNPPTLIIGLNLQ